MLLDEIKATLAMEKLQLTAQEERLLQDYAEERISFTELYNFLLASVKKRKAA